jgi:hypothetical protein
VPFPDLAYLPYAQSVTVPNVVVDGSGNAGTVLTLSHWPGMPTPEGTAADLSAQMVFRYVERGERRHGDAEVVTNNHFDQDGLVSVVTLADQEGAMARRALLEDVAAAGDFATYRDRRAARVSMALAAFADPERSPLAPLPTDYDEMCALLYQHLTPRLLELVDQVDDHRSLWEEEDRQLAGSEAALASGAVRIEERSDVDLAVVTVDEGAEQWSGHRFAAGRRFDDVHPMAVNNATDRVALLVVRGRRYRFTHRYETWVQFRSRPLPRRVDLAPLAEELTALETGGGRWQADPVGDITPQLAIADGAESSLEPDVVVERVAAHLASAPAAWDPYKQDVA